METGLSQEAVAHRAGISRNHLQVIEQGLSDRVNQSPWNPHLSVLVRLCDALEVDLVHVLRDVFAAPGPLQGPARGRGPGERSSPLGPAGDLAVIERRAVEAATRASIAAREAAAAAGAAAEAAHEAAEVAAKAAEVAGETARAASTAARYAVEVAHRVARDVREAREAGEERRPLVHAGRAQLREVSESREVRRERHGTTAAAVPIRATMTEMSE